MINPCENCKRKPNCPDVCYPKKDYKRALKKRAKRAKVATKIAKAREERRKCKNRAEELQPLVDYLTSDKGKTMLNSLREVLGKTRKAEDRQKNRTYTNRRLDKEDI